MFSEKDSALKVAAIGQAIMQATRPRALLSPLQIGLGVQLHHHFGSRFLIDTCHNLGFCAPYTEVQRFASCAAASQGTSIQGVFPESCLQFVADNVDHNIRTLDGNNTFHGMGIIAGVTPGVHTTKHIPRTPVTTDDLKQLGKIKIHHYRQHTNRMSELSFVELKDIQKMDSTLKLDNFTKIVWPLKSPMPGWAGFMQLLQTGTHPGKSAVTYLPMIDLSPSDMTTLKFVQEQAKTYDRTPIITFDQPLYWKAFTIISNEDQGSDMRSIVLRLGGFHLEMSFLGAISHIMRGSGLQQILETVYAPNAVLHMLTGKAIARALRGHMLVDIALHALLVSIVFRVPLHKEDDNGPVSETREETSDHTDESRDNLTKLSDMCDLLIAGDISVDALCNSSILVDVLNVFAAETQAMGKLRTASLWLQYSEMIQLLRSFIKAERTGDWELHLKCIQEMLPYLAAAGHNLYTKSAYTYLSEMQKLEYDNPDVYQQFLSGYHVFRRSDRYWAGLSCDLVIEQELMRSVKTSGGLTRGRGIGETQRAQWLLSMPACADINNALQVLTGVGFQTSDQHKETSEARKERDFKDITTIISFMNERNPFSDNESLRNIETGAIADKTVNQDIAKAVGERIIKSMVGKKILDYSFKRSQQVVTLGEKSCLKVDGDPIQIDPQLLFQRLTIAACGRFDDTSEIFKYELCSYPSSIFDSSGLPRVAQKATLAECIWNLGECGIESLPPDPDIIYVLDGGSLLQRISWNIGQSFSTICQSYVEFVKRNYTDAVVVFDGYRNELSTKDVAHMRRAHGVISQRIDFTEEMPCRCKKEAFLCNSKNKQRFIDMLSCKLQGNGCTTVHADEDADLLIVQTAVKCADIKDVVVIGEDTDLLVLLCYHSGFQFHNIYFKSDCKRSLGKQMKIWDINKTKAALGDVCRLLPALHALTGCDTTSRLFGIGKGPALNKLRSSDVLKDHAAVFLDPTSDVNSITKAGEELLTTWFGGMPFETLDRVRFRKFAAKTTTGITCVKVPTLPPTSNAARFHCMRAFFQCQCWIGEGDALVPQNWGWYITDNKLLPVKSSIAPAPEQLLKVIKCGCKLNCDTKRCSCRKNGLECTAGCSECKGVSCSNVLAMTNADNRRIVGHMMINVTSHVYL